MVNPAGVNPAGVNPAGVNPAGTPRSVSCSVCGAVEASPPLTWMVEIDPRRGEIWFCERCARDIIRSIESKLDREWW